MNVWPALCNVCHSNTVRYWYRTHGIRKLTSSIVGQEGNVGWTRVFRPLIFSIMFQPVSVYLRIYGNQSPYIVPEPSLPSLGESVKGGHL